VQKETYGGVGRKFIPPIFYELIEYKVSPLSIIIGLTNHLYVRASNFSAFCIPK